MATEHTATTKLELIDALKQLINEFGKGKIDYEELHIRRDNLLIGYICNAEVSSLCNKIQPHIHSS